MELQRFKFQRQTENLLRQILKMREIRTQQLKNELQTEFGAEITGIGEEGL